MNQDQNLKIRDGSYIIQSFNELFVFIKTKYPSFEQDSFTCAFGSY